MTPADKDALESLGATRETVSIELYPEPYQEAQEFVILPLSRAAVSKRGPRRDHGNPVEVKVYRV